MASVEPEPKVALPRLGVRWIDRYIASVSLKI